MTGLKSLRLLLGVALAVVLLLPTLVLKLGIEPAHRAFRCNASDYAYPYNGHAIPYFLLISGCFACSSVIIIITEYFSSSRARGYIDIQTDGSLHTRSRRTTRLPVIVQYLEIIVPLLLAVTATEMIKNFMAHSLGFLRPHFLAVCRPDLASPDCLAGIVREHPCTQKDLALLKEARLSFPSGHAAIAMTCAVFTVCYLHTTMRYQAHLTFFYVFLSTILICVALYLGFLTTNTYMHHLQDVLGGFLLGGCLAWVCAAYSLTWDSRRLETKTETAAQ